MGRKLVVGRMWSARTVQQYVALHQLHSQFWDFELEVHLLIDNLANFDEYLPKMVELDDANRPGFPMRVIYYTIPQVDAWLRTQGIPEHAFERFRHYKQVYNLFFMYYLWKELGIEYMLTFDDDIMLNGDLGEVDDLVVRRRPWVIDERVHCLSDKSMLVRLSTHFKQDLTKRYYAANPMGYGCNEGFMGVNLRTLFRPFGDYMPFLGLFSFDRPAPAEGPAVLELWETQLQSFVSVMTHCFSVERPVRLGDGYMSSDLPLDQCLDSKVLHFTGDRKYGPMFRLMQERYIKSIDEKR
jgi:hypothetical protein